MFFRMQNRKRPEGGAPGKMPKKKAAAKDQAAAGGNKKYEDYINAFEQRKKEQAARRFQLLFLKRLENDGQRILMSK